MKELIDRFLVLRQERKDAQDMLAEIVGEFHHTEEAIVEGLRGAGLNKVTADSGHTLRLCPQTFATSVDGMDDLVAALKTDPDSAWLVRETVHMQTLSAWVREKLSDGGIPEPLQAHIGLNEITHLGVCKDRDTG
jgi:hypothetical protein